MKYEFEGTVEFRENENTIAVPFNVWEVCEKVGDAPVRVCFGDVCFICDLVPKGQGYYDIPVSQEILSKIELGRKYKMSIEIVGNTAPLSSTSPYSLQNPIRTIDGIDLVTQPWDGLCGQACIAMIAGTTLDEACDIMKCREWQANMSKMIATLEYLGIGYADAGPAGQSAPLLHYHGEDGAVQPLSGGLRRTVLRSESGRYQGV